MRKSKLLELLSTFDATEWGQFNDFVASPFFNKNESVIRLCTFLADHSPELEVSKEKAFAATFPGEPFDDKQLGYVMNYLMALAEQFLSIRRYQEDEVRQSFDALATYSNRKLDKHYGFLHRKTRRKLKELPLSTGLLLKDYQCAEIEANHFWNQKVRRFDPSTQQAYEKLNAYYYLQLLKYTCSLMSMQMVLSGEFQFSPITEQMIKALHQEEAPSPLIAIYLKIYDSISTPEEENGAHFRALMGLIEKHGKNIEQEERREIYLLAINFCARKIRKGENEYSQIVLKIYEDGVRSRSLFENGYLSHWTYTNVVKLALYNKRYDWAEQFIYNYKDDLPPSAYDDAFHYNLAELFFYRKNYSEALEHLQHLNFTDPYYSLGSRLVLLKTFYELDETESLLSLLASFTIFLKRNKDFSSAYQKTCLNFCKLLHQALKRKPGKREELKEQIEATQPLAERPWLLKVWEEQGERVRG